MHINLDLLECVHLTCAMLLEIPNIALSNLYIIGNTTDQHGNFHHIIQPQIISMHFRRLLDLSEKAKFSGPPEGTRETIIAAAKNLRQGDWKDACKLLFEEIKVWKLFPNFEQSIKKMLTKKMKEESLRTYLLTYCVHYDSIKSDFLCNVFELSENEVSSLVTKMMMNNEIKASWDQPTSSIILHKVEPTHLQALSLRVAESTGKLVESNERTLDKLTGSYHFGKDDNMNSDDRKKGRNNRDQNNYVGGGKQQQRNSSAQGQQSQQQKNRGNNQRKYVRRGNYQQQRGGGFRPRPTQFGQQSSKSQNSQPKQQQQQA
jgi:translation initiation factor 3 subunit C